MGPQKAGAPSEADDIIRGIRRSSGWIAMTEENSAEKSRPTSPEEKAEYYREFEAARRENPEAIRRDIDKYVKEGNDRAIKQRIEDRINSCMD